MEGYCGTCMEVVVIDGRPADEQETVWSHLRISWREIIGAEHHWDCTGDCGEYCPVPVQYWEPHQIECGPVYLGGPE